MVPFFKKRKQSPLVRLTSKKIRIRLMNRYCKLTWRISLLELMLKTNHELELHATGPLTVCIRPKDSLVLKVTFAFSCIPKISGLSTVGSFAKYSLTPCLKCWIEWKRVSVDEGDVGSKWKRGSIDERTRCWIEWERISIDERDVGSNGNG